MNSRFTTRRLFEFVILLGLFIMAVRGTVDPDFGWHLRTGQFIAATGSVPHADIFSHTMRGAPWIAHEWLSELFMYGVYRLAGHLGLLIAFAAIIAAAFWIAYLRSEGRPYFAGIATLWGAIATIPFWGFRPQMLSLLLTSIFLFLLDRFDRSGRTALLWWCPPLMVVWVNSHGAFAVGLALLGAAVACKLLDAMVAPDSRTRSLADARSLSVVLLVSLATVIINPNGYRMYLYPFETLAAPAIQAYISEWASPNFHLPSTQPFALLLITVFALLGLGRKRPSTRDFVLLLVTSLAALRSARHVPLFALVAIPILSSSLQSLTAARGWFTSLHSSDTRTSGRALNYAVAVALVLVCVIRVRTVADLYRKNEAAEMPVAAAGFLSAHRPPGPIFNSYEWGGYLVWTLYPDYPVFIDGRCDMYGERFLDEFVATYKAQNDWRNVLDRFGVNAIVLPPESPLARIARQDDNWDTAFEDSSSVVLLRKSSLSSSVSLP